jgi:hypothetical protein
LVVWLVHDWAAFREAWIRICIIFHMVSLSRINSCVCYLHWWCSNNFCLQNISILSNGCVVGAEIRNWFPQSVCETLELCEILELCAVQCWNWEAWKVSKSQGPVLTWICCLHHWWGSNELDCAYWDCSTRYPSVLFVGCGVVSQSLQTSKILESSVFLCARRGEKEMEQILSKAILWKAKSGLTCSF